MGKENGVEVDTTNSQFVGRQGDRVAVLFPKALMAREEALRHAAWLVALAEEKDGEFAEVLEAVRNT